MTLKCHTVTLHACCENGPLWPKIACYMLHQTSLIKNHMSHHFTVVFDISDEDYCSTITILMAFTLLGTYPKNVSFEFSNFGISTNFCQKCRRCSLRSKYCKMRLFYVIFKHHGIARVTIESNIRKLKEGCIFTTSLLFLAIKIHWGKYKKENKS